MSIKYQILVKEELLIDISTGSVDIECLNHLMQNIWLDQDFIHVRKIFSDIRGAKFNLTFDDIQNFLKIIAPQNGQIDAKWAILTNNPKDTALSMLLKEHPFFNSIIGIFSSLEACNQFLESNITESLLDEGSYHL